MTGNARRITCNNARLRRVQTGFTLIELVSVLILVGILSVVAMPKFFDKNSFQGRGFHDETLALLRYAQKSAVAQRRTVCVTVAATGVSLNLASSAGSTTCATNLNMPSTAVGGSGLSGNSFKFLASGATDQTGTITLAITGASSINIDAVTGYVR